jgi:hypothetical protein
MIPRHETQSRLSDNETPVRFSDRSAASAIEASHLPAAVRFGTPVQRHRALPMNRQDELATTSHISASLLPGLQPDRPTNVTR